MAERPILFNAAMVRALLAGTKTQTRRVVKMKPHHQIEQRDDGRNWPWMYDGDRDSDSWMACPYGQPGDRLWVREAWAAPHKYDGHRPADIPSLTRWHYAATENLGGLLGRPSIHMPRCASRITLEVTGVRVERLQDISESDAEAEGAEYGFDCEGGFTLHPLGNRRHGYAHLWEEINGAGSWDANPWVWVVEFKRLEATHG